MITGGYERPCDWAVRLGFQESLGEGRKRLAEPLARGLSQCVERQRR